MRRKRKEALARMGRQAKASNGTRAFPRPGQGVWGAQTEHRPRSQPSLSVMSVLRRLQHGASIQDRYPERVDFEKSPWGNSWVTPSPSPSRTTWRRRRGHEGSLLTSLGSTRAGCPCWSSTRRCTAGTCVSPPAPAGLPPRPG